jgi:hypothetical protein
MAALPSFEALTALAASRKSEVDLAVTETDSGLDVALTGALPLDPGGFGRGVEDRRARTTLPG